MGAACSGSDERGKVSSKRPPGKIQIVEKYTVNSDKDTSQLSMMHNIVQPGKNGRNVRDSYRNDVIGPDPFKATKGEPLRDESHQNDAERAKRSFALDESKTNHDKTI